MAPERFPPDDPREWLNRAKGNLIQAKGEEPGVYWEDLCFQAQQAAEKSFLRFPIDLFTIWGYNKAEAEEGIEGGSGHSNKYILTH